MTTLEFATERARYYDLARWEIAEPALNAYIAVETNRRSFPDTAHFTAGCDEYLPVPQSEITFTNGLYKQNPRYKEMVVLSGIKIINSIRSAVKPGC